MAKLLRLLIDRPVFSWMLILTMLAAALLVARTVSLELVPNMVGRSLVVNVRWADASPESVETRVVSQIEQAAATLRGVQQISSESRRGAGTVTVGLTATAGVESVRFNLKDALRRIPFPDGAAVSVRVGSASAGLSWNDPIVRLLSGLPSASDLPFRVRLSSRDSIWLEQIARADIRNVFLAGAGVAGVSVSGGEVQRLEVTYTPGDLAARGLEPEMLLRALSETSGSERELGWSRDAGAHIPVVGMLPAIDLEAVERAEITTRDGRAVRLGSVCSVSLRSEPPEDRGRVDGEPAVLVDVAKKEEANLVQFSRQMRATVARIESQYGDRLAVEVLSDEGHRVEAVLLDLGVRLSGSVAAVVLALLIFFRRVRPALLVLVALVFTLVLTVAILALSGISVSMVSVAALVLAAGLLVDNSLIMYEYLHAARQRSDVAGRAAHVIPVIGVASLTNAVVFAPFLFFDGPFAQLLVPFAVTMVAAMVCSVIVSIVVVPVVYVAVIGTSTRRTRGRLRIDIRPVLRTRRVIVPLVLAGTVYVLAVLLPDVWNSAAVSRPASTDSVSVSIGMLSDARVEETDDIAGDFEAIALDIVNRIEGETSLQVVVDVHRTRAAVRVASREAGARELLAAERRALLSVEQRWMAQMGNYVSVGLSMYGPSGSVFGGGTGEAYGPTSGQAVQFTGYDYEILKQHVLEFSAHMSRIPALYAIDNGFVREKRVLFGPSFPGYDLYTDPGAMRDAGVTITNLRSALSLHLLETRSLLLPLDGEDLITVHLTPRSDTQFFRMEEMLDLVVADTVRLGDIADLRPLDSALSIRRENQQYTHEVRYKVRPNQAMEARAALATLIETYPFPPGFTAVLPTYQFREQEQRQRNALGLSAVAAAVLVFMVLAGHFESFLRPLLVFLSIPLALVAVVTAYAIAGTGFGLGGLLGLVVLSGIAVNDAVLFASEINRIAPRSGSSRVVRPAVRSVRSLFVAPAGRRERIAAIAVRRRLRAILVTTFTTVVALLPSLFVSSTGAEFAAVWREFAIVVIAGLAASTAATVLVLPAVYALQTFLVGPE